MDPITLIVTALVAGASKIGGEAAADAYRHLLAAVRRHFAGHPQAENALGAHAGDPATGEMPLRQYLTERHVDADPTVTAAAQAVLTAVQQHTGPGQVNVKGGEVIIESGADVTAHDIGSATYTQPG